MLTILVTSTLIAATAAPVDAKCRYLEELNRQYAGLTLSTYEQQVKRQMVAWYRQNCIKRS